MTNHALIEASMDRVHQLLTLGMWEAAAGACDELLRLAPDDARAWHYGGRVLLQQQRLAEAETALRQAAKLAPDDGVVWDLLSIACYLQSKWPETADACRRAVAQAPGEAITWTRLGAALRALGQLRPAEGA